MGRLDGKVALVTGAARGQGRSHALRLAEEGADIIAIDLCAQPSTVDYPMPTEADLGETAELVERLDRRVVAAVADVRDLEQLQTAVRSAVGELGSLDVVCANAGISTLGFVRDMPTEVWQEMLDINLTGVFTTAKVTLEHLIRAGGGSFIATSSIYGLKATGGIAHYVAAKHGVTGLVKALAVEWAPYGIRVNSVHPTTVATPMVQNEVTFTHFRPDLDAPALADIMEPLREMNLLDTPWVESADVSHAVVYLASDEARFVTGVALPIDAGALLR